MSVTFNEQKAIKQMQDRIDLLPTDNSEPDANEIKIADFLLEKQSNLFLFFTNIKDLMIMAVLFFLLTLPFVDQLIDKYIPSISGSIYFKNITKAMIFIFLVFVIKNIYLVQK